MKLDRVVLSGAFEAEKDAEALFRRLLREGTISEICADFDFQGKPRGAPEMRRAEDGLLVPRRATLEHEQEGETFLLSFDRSSLKIQGPASQQALMESWLEGCLGPRASAFFRGLPDHVLARVYEQLGRPHPEGTRLRLDRQGRQIPEKLRHQDQGFTVEFATHQHQVDLILHTPPAELPQAVARLRQLVEPSRRRGQVQSLRWQANVSGYTWSRLGGLGEVAGQLRDWIELPLRNPEAFQRLGLRPPRGVLLCGPPGTGKTTLARILACESQAAFFTISPGDLASSWYGQTEKNLRRIFSLARSQERAILFVDEIDGFFRSREAELNEPTRRALAQIMTEMDGLVQSTGVVVLGATNRAEDLDPALRRPGRFDHEVHLGLPDEAARREILAIHLAGKPQALDLDELARRSQGQSGADLELWCNSAAYRAWKRAAAARGKDPAELTADELAEVQLGLEDF